MESVVSSTTVTCLIVVAALLVIVAVVGGILAYKFWKNTAAREQKFKDELNDDTPWGEYPFDTKQTLDVMKIRTGVSPNRETG